MKMKKLLYIAAMVACLHFPFSTCLAGILDSLDFKVRAGYNLGGTVPLPLPASIRSIDAFRPTFSPMVGASITLPVKFRLSTMDFGFSTGLRFENKGMDAEVTVKSYRIEMRRGDSELNGLFTGHVKQEVEQWMLSLPLDFQFSIKDFQFRVGPYVSLVVSKQFSGIASDGYLRQGDPTGPKIEIGDKEGEWATYDFSDDMRKMQWGLNLGIDWLINNHIGFSAELNWGFSGIFQSDFKTVEQSLHPIYGTVGVLYEL